MYFFLIERVSACCLFLDIYFFRLIIDFKEGSRIFIRNMMNLKRLHGLTSKKRKQAEAYRVVRC
jgi:hypothetical protein